MDPTHFDDMARSLDAAASRRSIVTRIAAATLVAVAVQLPSMTTAKNKKKKSSKKLSRNTFGCVDVGKACRGKDANCCSGICQGKKPKKGKCKGAKPDDTTCNGDGKCFAGACIPRPTCLASASACTQPAAGACCSGICSAAHGDLCLFSDPGEPCYTGSDCNGAPLTPCIAYRCR